jgi:outer membrane protein assembly factor BamB
MAKEGLIKYSSPVDGSELAGTSENIILRLDEKEFIPLNNIIIEVQGSISREISGNQKLLSDGRTLVFDPLNDFIPGEHIRIILKNKNENKVTDEFSFKVDPSPVSEIGRNKVLQAIRRDEFVTDYTLNDINNAGSSAFPSAEPDITIHVNNNPAPGTIFLGNFANNPHLVAMKNTGQFLFIRQMPSPCYDFRLQENGLLTYFQNAGQKYYAMDSNYNVVDSFYTGNGYDTDLHELRILPNGNALIMSYDVKIIDMSKIVPGGQKNAQVTGLIIQEIDPAKNVIFQWRSWDHFEITDADSVNLSLGVIDYCHGNALEIDYDGNIILSSRNMSEITKISRTTGNIIWRLGGKNNQFTFINDPIKFSYQHAIRRTSAGTYTLYDNGNFHVPKFSRAVEYRLNETNRTCELIWEYRRDPLIYSFAMGYVERLPNGNTSISWGFSNITYTEVTPTGETAYEFSLGNLSYSYRVVKENWFVNPVSIQQQFVNSYELTYNYPNPFNGSTIIYFELLRSSNVNIKAYDALGKEIKTLVSNEYRRAGKYSVNFSSEKLASGLYYYVLETDAGRYVHKMMLMK